MRLLSVSHVACDSGDRVYVYQRGSPPVMVFDREGTFLDGWGDEVILDAHGIFITHKDDVLLIDRDGHRLLVFDANGKLRQAIGDAEHPRLQAPFNHPADVAVDAGGNVYVADGYGNSCVHRFSKTGDFMSSWGTPGSGPGQFTTPHAVWAYPDGRVFVADRENDRVQVFDENGGFLQEWRDLYHPMDIYVDGEGLIFITDQVPRLSMLSPEGRLLGRCKPVPVGAHGIWGDSRGDLYLAEGSPLDRITKLVRID